MSFLSLLLVVVLAHFFPFSLRNILAKWQSWLFFHFETGKKQDARLAFLVAFSPVLLLAFFSWWVSFLSFWVALVFNVFVLWLSMDFLPYYRRFLRITEDLSALRLESAREELAQFDVENEDSFSTEGMAQRTLKAGFLHAHVHFFAPFLFFLFLGAAGAFFYALMFHFSRKMADVEEHESAFQMLCLRVFNSMDWLASCFSAFSFALMGNFEPAFSMLRQFGLKFGQSTLTVIQSGCAALSLEKGSIEALLQEKSLVERVFLLWLVLVLFVSAIAQCFFMF